MTATLRQAAGSLLMVGVSGAELTGLERAWLRLVRPAGIILFRRNIADAKQTRALLAAATAECAPHSLRCVDVEGGTVDRLRDALTPMPSAQAVARADSEKLDGQHSWSPTHSQKARMDGAPPIVARARGTKYERIGFAREHGELVARAVKAFGFNTTLAPVLDLGLPESAAVMGTRCASPDAAGVMKYVRAFLAGLASQGVAGCGKHFPGLGGGTLDSHLETPKIEREWREMWNADMEPYRALRGELPMVMVSHAAYPETKGEDRPASVSKFWIETVLRKRIEFRGLVVSDDLEMGGILRCMSIEEAAVEAVRAGTELVEVCHSPELILRAYEALVAEGERSAAFHKVLMERARSAGRKRARLFADRSTAALSSSQFEALRARIVRFGERVEKVAG